jgi:hypothetical protein
MNGQHRAHRFRELKNSPKLAVAAVVKNRNEQLDIFPFAMHICPRCSSTPSRGRDQPNSRHGYLQCGRRFRRSYLLGTGTTLKDVRRGLTENGLPESLSASMIGFPSASV